MGQKANPIGSRLGIIKGWDSNWFGGKNYSDKLVEDEKIRKYLSVRIAKGGVAKVVIERTLKRITVTIHSARPGIVIGKGGQEVDKIKEELKKLTKKDVQINIFEIKRPELDAKLVAEGVAKQLEARISFRRAMKTSIASTMRMGAEGIKIMCSGRLGGTEMARTEQYKEGRKQKNGKDSWNRMSFILHNLLHFKKISLSAYPVIRFMIFSAQLNDSSFALWVCCSLSFLQNSRSKQQCSTMSLKASQSGENKAS